MMRTRRPIMWMVVALLVTTTPAVAAPAPAQKIVDRWLRGKSLRGLQVGVSIVDTASGASLGAHNGAKRMNPASGTKLLTSAAALHLLPMQPRWETRVHGVVQGDALAGPLRLVGGGDPKLLIAHIETLAEAVDRAGVKRVPEGIVVHAGHFDSTGLPPAYDQKRTDAGYRPAVGAAAANFAAVRVTVRPGKRPGAKVRVSVEGGADAVDLQVGAKTVVGNKRALTVKALQTAEGRTQIVVTGTMGRKAKAYDTRKRLADPDRWTGAVLQQALSKRGITTEARVEVTRDPLPAETGEALGSVSSRSLPETLLDVNTWSNNFMAETVFKQMGCADQTPCSWQLATERVTGALQALGLPENGFKFVNGSGLYRATTVSPETMTTLLVRMAADPIKGPSFMGSLAVSGRPGTLHRRLTSRWTRGKVKGKTGTLDEVVSLSGYVPSKTGRTLAFSVLVNGATPKRTGAIRRKIDRLVRLLTRL